MVANKLTGRTSSLKDENFWAHGYGQDLGLSVEGDCGYGEDPIEGVIHRAFHDIIPSEINPAVDEAAIAQPDIECVRSIPNEGFWLCRHSDGAIWVIPSTLVEDG